jgi:hypothetical protein
LVAPVGIVMVDSCLVDMAGKWCVVASCCFFEIVLRFVLWLGGRSTPEGRWPNAFARKAKNVSEGVTLPLLMESPSSSRHDASCSLVLLKWCHFKRWIVKNSHTLVDTAWNQNMSL